MNETAQPFVSVVVPLGEWNEWAVDCLRACLELSYPAYDIWFLPNRLPEGRWKELVDPLTKNGRVHLIPTGPGNPARKRNVAMEKSTSNIFALVDDDACPARDWLARAVPLIRDQVAIVAGPNVTPPQDPILRRITGNVMESPLGFGGAYLRHVPLPRRLVNEMPTCNMILQRLEGVRFREDMDTAEDMMLCHDYRSKGFQIVYDPGVVVYHHRRKLGKPFAKQFFNYGFDKGRMWRHRAGDIYWWHLIPACFFLYLLIVPLAFLLPGGLLRWLALAPALCYGLLVLLESTRKARNPAEWILNLAGFLMAHLSYGAGTASGIASGKKPAHRQAS